MFRPRVIQMIVLAHGLAVDPVLARAQETTSSAPPVSSATPAGGRWVPRRDGGTLVVDGLQPGDVLFQVLGDRHEPVTSPVLIAPGARYYVKSGGQEHALTIPAPSRSEKDPSSCDEGTSVAPTEEQSVELCREHAWWDEDRSLCYRVDGSLKPELVLWSGKLANHVLPANTSLRVLVVHAPGVDVEVALGGEREISTPATDNGFVPQAGPTHFHVTPRSFAPRKVDTAPELTVKASIKGQCTKSASLELYVEKSYSGAIRLGIGALYGPVRDHDYRAERVDGSAQHEIVATSAGRSEFELVAGYAPFLFDGKKGRAYNSTSLRERAYGFAPYIGLGVLNVASPTGVEFFKSVHLGLEWEPQRNLSIALTMVGRRVTEVRPGYAVGAPISGTDVPTRERLAIGVGLVLNLTPEFLRFATRGSSSLLRGTKD